MKEKPPGQELAEEVLGKASTPKEVGRNAAAAIYHDIFLHNPPSDPEVLAGISKNLAKLLLHEEFEKLRSIHQERE